MVGFAVNRRFGTADLVGRKVSRYWVPLGSEISLFLDGFMPDPAGEWGGKHLGGLLPLSEIPEAGLILIGEPGLGKTTALRAEYERLRDRIASGKAGDSLAQWVPLGQTRDLTRFRELIFEADAYREWTSGSGTLHLYLDSLDEARLKIEHAAEVLINGFEDADFSRLNLRLTCRSADRHQGLEETLRQRFGEERFSVQELAPLSRHDVELLAAERGLDAERTVRAFIEADLQPLAMAPETLGFLLENMAATGELPRDRAKLYEGGLTLMVREPDEDRREDPQQKQARLSPGARLAVASRVAAALLLSGRTAVTTKSIATNTDQATLANLSGGEECDELLAVPERFAVDEEAIKDVIGTGLFTAHPAGGMGFAQATYAEFLCARWLASGALAENQLESSLYIEVSGRARVVPQLREVATWLARLSPRFRDQLLQRDPRVLLRADPAALDDEGRAQLVEALLAGTRTLEIERWDRATRQSFPLLSHRGIAEQLRAVICNREDAAFTRQVACDLVGDCELSELSGTLCDLALDKTEDLQVRIAAVGALEDMGAKDDRLRLRPLALEPQPDDSEDELKGHALSALWPEHLSAEELFEALSAPKRTNLYGAYKAFLWRGLTRFLATDDLPAALGWAAGLPVEPFPTDALSDVKEQILARAWPELERREDLINPFVAAIVPTLRQSGDLLSSTMRKEHPELFTKTQTRRLLAEPLIKLVERGELEPFDLISTRPGILQIEDTEWMVERLETVVGTEREEANAKLARGLLMYAGADLEAIYRGREKSPLLREMTVGYFDPVPLDSPEASEGREHYADQRRWEREESEEELKLDIRGGVAKELERYRDGNLVGFWVATRWLEIDPKRQEYEFTVSDPRRLAGWELIGTVLQASYAEAASSYLEKGQIESEEWFEKRSIFWPAWAGYRALRLLYETDRTAIKQLDGAIWKRWAPIIVNWPRTSSIEGESEFNDWSLARLQEKAPRAANHWLLRRLDRELRRDPTPEVLWRFEQTWNADLEEALLRRARRSDRDPDKRINLLRVLIERGSEQALDHARRLLKPAALKEGRRRQLAVGIAALLYREVPDGAWDLTSRLISLDEKFGHELVENLAARESGLPPKMKAGDAADFYLWVLNHYPLEEDPDIDGVHSVSVREQIGDWRNRLISILSQRGSPEAVAALGAIYAKRPELLYLRRLIWDAKEMVERSEWQPPLPQDIIRLSAQHSRFFLRSAQDLRRVVLQSLDRAQRKLSGNRDEAVFLWNVKPMRPRPERHISQWLANHLRDDLGKDGVFVGRELEVSLDPSGSLGRAVDIVVAANPSEDRKPASPLVVMIEVKGCWNRDLDTAMREQLLAEYLDADNDQGIYLVAQFESEDWDKADRSNQQRCARRDLAASRAFFEAQAEQLSAEGLSDISSYVLDCRLQGD